MKNLIPFLFWSLFLFACEEEAPVLNFQETPSTARFAKVGNALYAVGERDLKLFDLSVPESPLLQKTISLGVNVQKVTSFENFLFVYSHLGLYVYDATNKQQPAFFSQYAEALPCNSLAASTDFLYLAQRKDSLCGSAENQVQVLDFRNPRNITEKDAYFFSSPYAVAANDGKLFLAEGEQGVKVFTLRRDGALDSLAHLTGQSANQILTWRQFFLFSSPSGIYQYNFREDNSMVLLSELR